MPMEEFERRMVQAATDRISTPVLKRLSKLARDSFEAAVYQDR